MLQLTAHVARMTKTKMHTQFHLRKGSRLEILNRNLKELVQAPGSNWGLRVMVINLRVT